MCDKIKLGFKIYSLNNDNYEFSIEELPVFNNIAEVDDKIAKFLYDFYLVFATETQKVNDNQVNLMFNNFIPFNKDLKNKLDNFVGTYKIQYPKLNALRKYFDNINDDEFICVLPSLKKVDTKEELEITRILHELNNKEFVNVDKLFHTVVENYNIHYYGDILKRIGHKNKADRVCRWCHQTIKSTPAVTFDEKAHAISEALGNKNLYLYDECDTCNHNFAATIELDFIKSIQILNTVWGVQGKNGIPKIKTHNLEIQHADSSTLVSSESGNKKITEPLSFSYNAGTITSQNIYRALCKFALSVLEDENVLNKCTWTTDWISNKHNLEKTPLVYKALIGCISTSNPIITITY